MNTYTKLRARDEKTNAYLESIGVVFPPNYYNYDITTPQYPSEFGVSISNNYFFVLNTDARIHNLVDLLDYVELISRRNGEHNAKVEMEHSLYDFFHSQVFKNGELFDLGSSYE